MGVYTYEALDSQGVSIKNEVEASNEKDAINKIRSMGYFPTKVRERGAVKKTGGKAGKPAVKKRRGASGGVKVKLVTQFARQLSTLQDAGLPILRSLRILEEQQKAGTFRRVIGYVADDIEGGATLSEAMGKFPKCFDRLLVSMVAAGETGGVLDLILSRVAMFMEKSQKLKARVKSAMIYPMVVIGAAFAIVLGLMKFVIPKFISVLQDMLEGGKMHPITRAVLGTSDWIAFHYGWVVVIGIPFGIWLVIKIIRTFKPGRYVLDAVTLRLPIVGTLVNRISITRWTRTLGTLIGAGVPILDAINVTRETAGNEVFANLLSKVHNSIRQGDTFAGPLRQSKIIDGIVTNMIAVGEETGDLDKMLIKIADNFDEQVDVLVAGLMSMLEPVMILVLGSIVMTIVLAVFLPMIQIITSLGSSAGK